MTRLIYMLSSIFSVAARGQPPVRVAQGTRLWMDWYS